MCKKGFVGSLRRRASIVGPKRSAEPRRKEDRVLLQVIGKELCANGCWVNISEIRDTGYISTTIKRKKRGKVDDHGAGRENAVRSCSSAGVPS